MKQARFKELKAIVAKVEFPGYTFDIRLEKGVCLVRIKYDEPDVFTGVVETQYGRDWKIEDNWDGMQLVNTLFKALLTSLEHRARENFLYDRAPIMHPHRTLEEAWTQAAGQVRSTEFTMPAIDFDKADAKSN
jgi:hypothetical protein